MVVLVLVKMMVLLMAVVVATKNVIILAQVVGDQVGQQQRLWPVATINHIIFRVSPFFPPLSTFLKEGVLSSKNLFRKICWERLKN